MSKVKKEFITLPLSEIHPYEKNPRINDDAVADVKESIRQCENLDPIEIDENNVILSGHTRYKALTELGYTETECLRYTGVSEAKSANIDCLQIRQVKRQSGILIYFPKKWKALTLRDMTLILICL